MPRLSAIMLVCALALSVTAAWLLWRTADGIAQGNSIETVGGAIGGPFALIDQDGRKRTDKDFRGRFVLLYFGYTFCPDVCPTTLAAMATTLGKLGPKADRIVPVFVTVDPKRDTPSVLKTYLANFGPRFVGLTGTPKDIARIAHAYRVYYASHALQGGGYSVDHSSVIYLLDPNGKFVKAYDDAASPTAIADDLKRQF